MMRRARLLAAAGALLVSACSAGSDAAPGPSPDEQDTSVAGSTAPAAPTTTQPAGTTATTRAATTTTVPEPSTECVVAVAAGDSLGAVAERADLTLDELLDENRMSTQQVIHPGDELDVCVGNDVDDVTGASRLPPSPEAVRRQQQHLNELFAPYMIAELAVDGDSGPLTRQLLCAARMGLGLPVSATNMSEGSPEEAALFAAESLSIPEGAATWANRWILVDETCQVIFTGEADDRIVNVFPTSTGEPGYGTRNVAGVAAFRFDPALDNGGWHDSSRFPVEVDNPLNGNMYKPLYFSDGQAIHGANYVPPEPRSKGCARLFPWHHDVLLAWLGLDDVTEATWRRGEIGVTVTVQGEFRPAD